MSIVRVLGFASVALVAAACSQTAEGEPDAGIDAGVEVSPVEMCTRMAAAHCELLQRCWPAFARDTPGECQAQEQSRCLDRYTALKPSFEADKVEIDVDRVLSCEERMKSSACAPSFPPGYGAALSPFADCRIDTGLLRGLVPSGQTCDESVECAPGTVCVKPGAVCSGTCSALPTEGEPCGFGCGPGLFCDDQKTKDPIDDRCAPPRGLNAPCANSTQCAEDLWCDGSTCKQRGSLGDPCIHDPNRLSTCAPGLACDVIPFIKTAGVCVVPLPQGASCRYHWSCSAGLICYDLDLSKFPDAEGAPGSCQSPMPVDAPCGYTPYSVFLGEECGAGMTCSVDRSCVTRPELGEACNPSSQPCKGSGVYCKPSESSPDQGTCTRSAGLHERCATRLDDARVVSIPCESGYCDREGTLNCLPPSKALGQECGEHGECLSGRCAVQEDRTLRCAEACL